MARCLTIVRYGELALRKGNREQFERRLEKNIREAVAGCDLTVSRKHGRLYVEADERCTREVEHALSHTFGIVGFARVLRVAKEADAIEQAAVEAARALNDDCSTFKIEAKRIDKRFQPTSYELAVRLGDAIQREIPRLSVDVRNPAAVIRVEVRDAAYVYGPETSGPRGLPLGSSGRGVLLLSGGIDSPVAGYLMGARGLSLEAVYFHTPPYTSPESLEKVHTLCRILSPWLRGLRLHVVPFTEIQVRIREQGPLREGTLLTRASMMRIAERISLRRGAGALVTGESLGQVASQTIESLRFTGASVSLPVLRPLIGMDKEQIVAIARKIGTFDTSTLPYDDCCTVFAPPHPVIKPDFQQMLRSLAALSLESMEEEAAGKAESVAF